jgi:hypothetical protein
MFIQWYIAFMSCRYQPLHATIKGVGVITVPHTPSPSGRGLERGDQIRGIKGVGVIYCIAVAEIGYQSSIK